MAVASYTVAISLAYLLLLRPLFAKVEQVKAENAVTEEYLILKNNATRLSMFKSRLAVFNRATTLRATLDSLAAPADVKVVSVAPDSAAQTLDAGFLLQGFQVTVEGNYHQVTKLLSALEHTNNYYLLTRLTIARTDNRSGLARAQFILRVLTVPELKREPPRRGTGSNSPEPSRTVTSVRNG
ncbi:MAG: hypothetical protein HY710_16855 [Candidatus Latescibacteria bacterium]|nr:hypothetical protein [Candidatus Latescibacterota bacterium]